MRNEVVLNQLPTATRTGWIPSYLLNEKGEVLFTFLYNPESKRQSIEIVHRETETALTSTQNLQYAYTKGQTLILKDLLMESWGSGRSLRPLLDKLIALAKGDPANGNYAPPVVYFSWGSYVSPPSVLTESIDWTETAWLGGEPAEVRLNLTLKEVPPPPTPAEIVGESLVSLIPANEEAEAAEALTQAIQAATNTITTNTLTSTIGSAFAIVLSDRQKADGVEAARQWLSSNVTSLSADIKQAYRTNSYDLSVATDGTVSLSTQRSGTVSITEIGTYDGRSFTEQ